MLYFVSPITDSICAILWNNSPDSTRWTTGHSQNKIQHQRHRKHNHKCPNGQRQGLAVSLRLNFTHFIQLLDDWMQGHKVNPDGNNGGDHRTDGNDLIAEQHHHNQKGQKNQLAVGYPVHQILHKQLI